MLFVGEVEEHERIWGVNGGGADEEVGEGGKGIGSEKKEGNGRARKRRILGHGESRDVWEMKEINWWAWGRKVNWKEMNKLEELGDEDIEVRRWEKDEWEKKEELAAGCGDSETRMQEG